jgi:hypothetical protein
MKITDYKNSIKKTEMKNAFKLKKSIAFVMLMSLMMAFTAMDKAPAYDPSGTWSYEIDTGDGVLVGDMKISKTADGYAVKIETDDFGTLELEDVLVKEMEMTGNVTVEGVLAEFEVEFEGDSMSGVVNYGGQELPIEAEREK